MSENVIRISCPVDPGQDPLSELQNLLYAYVHVAPYVPSDPITLGLYFMLVRGDPPPRLPEVLEAAKRWLLSGSDQTVENSLQAYELWKASFNLNILRFDYNSRFLERVLLLYGRQGFPGSRERYHESLSASQDRLREKLLASRRPRKESGSES